MTTQLKKETIGPRVLEVGAMLKAEGGIVTLVAVGVPHPCGCGNPECKDGIALSLEFDGAIRDVAEIMRKLFVGLPVYDQVQIATSMMKHCAGELLKQSESEREIDLAKLRPPAGGFVH